MQITIKLRSAYGKTLIDPVCDKAKILASIAGTSTLTNDTVKSAHKLGFKINVLSGEKPLWLSELGA